MPIHFSDIQVIFAMINLDMVQHLAMDPDLILITMDSEETVLGHRHITQVETIMVIIIAKIIYKKI